MRRWRNTPMGRFSRRHPLATLVIRRLLLGLLTLWVVSLIVFAATEALPGDAVLVKLNRNQTPEALEAIRQQLHLSEPLLSQYWLWLKDVLGGNLGDSLVNGIPISHLVGPRIENSLWLVLAASLIGIPLGLCVGVVSALKRDSFLDHGLSIGLLTAGAVPEFVLGIALILLLATTVFTVLPAVSSLDPSVPVIDQLNLLVLPALTLGLGVSPYIARMIRASMIEVLESDYVATARLKGLPERRVVTRHALVNAAGPTIQVSAIALAYFAGGVVVVESVFGYPGMGSALVAAVESRDVPLIQAITLFFALIYVGVNITADLLTVLITPRLRTASR